MASDDEGDGDGDAQYAAEYDALDAEAQAACLSLAPHLEGAAVALGDLDELCRLLRRPVRDAGERRRLMALLDPANAMRIDRAAFTAWLLQDLYEHEQLEAAPAAGGAFRLESARPAWEEIVDEAGATFFYNTLTGASAWELPRFVACLWTVLETAAEVRTLQAAVDVDGFLDAPSLEMVDDLRETFSRFDDDHSGSLDTSEFRDLCVAVGFLLGAGSSVLLATMQEIDPSSGGAAVRWEMLLHFWTNDAPFQRRTRLAAPFELWERVERLDSRAAAPLFRHVTTQSERWSHPQTEQRVVDLLAKLFPSAKLAWPQRIEMLYELQLLQATPRGGETDEDATPCGWTLTQCRGVFAQLGHECARREHAMAAVRSLNARFGGRDAKKEDATQLSRETVAQWMLHCVGRVEMDGWEEAVDASSGRRYFYHEVRGETQWDPPHLADRMASMMARFSGGAGSADDKIRRVFRHYDEDESGSISFGEFKRLYVALLGRREAVSGESDADDAQIQQVFSVLDTSGDDEVSLDEFMVWWKTKMNLEDEETEQQRREAQIRDRRRIAVEFLRHHDALVVKDAASGEAGDRDDEREDEPGARPTAYYFESNVLPRLVGVLTKYPLKGLAYRNALDVLVQSSRVVDQEIRLSAFLEWLAVFEEREREKEELTARKARALALLQAQEAAAKEKARKLKMIRKGQLLTKAIASDAGGVPEPAELVWKRHVETLFRKFDADNSGYLDAAELKQLTAALGHALDDAHVKQMMAVMDASGDERVSVDEFVTFWTAFQRRKRAADASSQAKMTARTKKTASDATHRREAVSMVDASASLAVTMELAKEKALGLTVGDVKDALGDWKESLLDRSRRKKEAKELAEQQRQRLDALKKEWAAFVPTKTRRYAHLDVTWIEPEVVRCVVDMIRSVGAHARPLPRPDAAQRIQRIMRGGVTRMRLVAMVCERFRSYVDVDTAFFYYVDTEMQGRVWLHRPLFRTITSSVAPWEWSDCRSKVERFQFTTRQRDMAAKKRFYEEFAMAEGVATAQWKHERRLYVPASFAQFTIVATVRLRLLGNIWHALRERAFVLAELMARRHTRQLTQRSGSDAAAPLPLHYVVKHHRDVPFSLVQAVYEGHADAVRERDAYGRTPLHLALRERAPWRVVELLLSRRSRLTDQPTRTSKRTSVWQMQSVSGETPLHVAVRYGVSLERLRWICRHASFVGVADDAATVRNQHGQSVFHLVVGTLFDGARAVYWRSVVLVLLRAWTSRLLCSDPNASGDLALHLAIDRFAAVLNQRLTTKTRSSQATENEDASWLWLLRLLIAEHPAALLVRRRHDSLLAIHLLIRASRIPESLVLETLRQTIDACVNHRQEKPEEAAARDTDLDDVLTLRESQATLLHYALLHRCDAETVLMEILTRLPRACRVKMQPQDELPLHLAARHGAHVAVMRALCETHGAACQERNKKRELPLHLAVASAAASEESVRALLHYCPFVLSDPRERRGLRALVAACSAARPNAGVLRALLEQTPPQPPRSRDVTPLFALALHTCGREVSQSGLPARLESDFETVENEDAYFVARAKAARRRRHHCPTAAWPIATILDLMERNPVDEAVIQRSLLALNDKLTQMLGAAKRASQPESGDDEIVARVTLNAEWMLVRRVHQTLFELPGNARVQLLGQAVLAKLLPTAFAKAAYRARLDPYCNL